MPKKWIPGNELNGDDLALARASLGIQHDLFVHVLWNRGIRSRQQWEDLVQDGHANDHSPFLMHDMDLAVSRIIRAKNTGEKVLVYGDYDVDGTTSVAMMYSFISGLGINCAHYIPDRYKEGYGVSRQGIDHAITQGFNLIIALDCGTRSVELVEYAGKHGIDFVICDHHIPGAQLPGAVAVLNPKRPDCEYPYKELSGCGIGFKLIQALVSELGIDPAAFEKYYDLVAVSIASDLVPITGENRSLMKKGLRKLMVDPLPGFRLITSTLPKNKKVSVSNVVFMIGPRINAAGRMASGIDAVNMMLANDEQHVAGLAHILESYNADRKKVDKSITDEALGMLQADPQNDEYFTTVVFQENWHKGVVGIVASRLMEKFYRPTIVLTRSGDVITGSARSIEGFNIHDALHECRGHLTQFGGHYYAAGMTLPPENLDAFREAFESVARKKLTPDHLVQKLQYDCEVQAGQLSLNVFDSLQKIAPFGPGNEKPMFVTRNLRDTGSSRRIGSDKSHLKLELACMETGLVVNGVAFGQGQKLDDVLSGPVDIIYHLEDNHYNGWRSMQLEVQDIQPSAR